MTSLKKCFAGVMSVLVFTLFLPQLAGADQKEFWLDNNKEEVTAQPIEIKSSPLRKIPEKEGKSYKWMWIASGVVLAAIVVAVAGGGGGGGGGDQGKGIINVRW